jgi:hypothetical protein
MSRTASAKNRSLSDWKTRNQCDVDFQGVVKKNGRNELASHVEERLFKYQAKAKVRLEMLRQSLEEEVLKEMQKKPKILSKSRKLAVKHDLKLMQDCSGIKEIESNLKKSGNCQEEGIFARQNHLERNWHLKEPRKGASITVESVPFTLGLDLNRKKTKSLSNFSFSRQKQLESQEFWIFQKKSEDLGKSNGSSGNSGKNHLNEEVLTPQSVETYADSVDHQGKILRNSLVVPRSLAPFQVKVSFECGIDLGRFLRRAK